MKAVLIVAGAVCASLVIGLYVWSPTSGVCHDCNVVMISLTNTQRDRLGVYGSDKQLTPNIDQFFNGGVVMDGVYAPSPWTLPNAVTLFTGQSPKSHRIFDRRQFAELSPDVLTYTEQLQSAGYYTVGFTGGGDYDQSYGLSRGFDEYVDRPQFGAISDHLEDIVSRLKQPVQRPFFLFAQGFDTHCPFTPEGLSQETLSGSIDPSICYWNYQNDSAGASTDGTVAAFANTEAVTLGMDEVQLLSDLYDQEIKELDQQLGRLFKVLVEEDLLDTTVVVVLAEHGDLVGEGDRLMRTDVRGTMRPEVLQIPFLVKIPSKAGGTFSAVDRLSLVFPYIFSLLGIEASVVQLKDTPPQGFIEHAVESDNKFFREGVTISSVVSGDEIHVREVNWRPEDRSTTSVVYRSCQQADGCLLATSSTQY